MSSSNLPSSDDAIIDFNEQFLSRRQALRLIAGTSLALFCAPAVARASTSKASEAWADETQTLGTESSANSWRYYGGTTLAHPDTDSGASASSLQTLSTTPYSTWDSSFGTSGFGIVSEEEVETENEDGSTETTTEEVVTTVDVSGVKRVGIDVSRWQGDIDWASVAEDGVSFAIIRCGYGSDWESQDDSYFLANVEGALAAGLSIGVYLYSYATQVSGEDSSAESEAAHVLRRLEEAGLEPGDLDLPVFLDMEDSSQSSLGASTLADIARTFCDAIIESGYKAGIYANKYWWSNYLTDSAFSSYGWYRWVARYPASTEVSSTGIDDTDIWQFTSDGGIAGINTDVDVDFDFVGKGGYAAQTVSGVGSSSSSDVEDVTLTLSWKAHIQTYGWKSDSSTMPSTATLGTTGESKRLEAIKLSLSNDGGLSGSIKYRAHCQTYGWLDWVSDGSTAGTTNESKRMEAVQIKLTGELAEYYDIYYRVHVQTYGWLDWAKNGATAGSAGYSKRAESIQIKIVTKGSSAPGSTDTPYVNKATLSVRAHQQSYGWLDSVASGETAGKAGSSKRLEALQITMSSQVSGSIKYRAHCQSYGWLDWVTDGATAGTTNKSKRLEALQIKLTGEAAECYTIWYRCYVQGYGWLGWATDGATSGTTNLSKRVEAVQVQILAKNASAPGSTKNTSYSG